MSLNWRFLGRRPAAIRRVMSPAQRQAYWEHEHTANDYRKVWSMTDAPDVRHKIIAELSAIDAKRILIPGCGSKVSLQNEIAERVPGVEEIVCTDFPAVIAVAGSQKNNSLIKYRAMNHADLRIIDEFDAAVIVNSILSEDDSENRSMVRSCHTALRPEGRLIGFFPTVFASLDISYLDDMEKWQRRLDLANSSFYEEKQNVWQIFYTPLKLRRILRATDFKISKFEIYFCDSDHFMEESKLHYGISHEDVVIYEHFVVAIK